MRVLHIDAGNIFGGVETFLLTLARCRDLCPEMVPEFAVCFEGRLAEELSGTGVRVHRLGAVRARNPLQVLRARRRLERILASGEIDVVVCHMPWVHAIFGPVAHEAALPVVFWLHLATDGTHWVEKWASFTQPELIIAPSNFVAGTAKRIFPSPPVKVVNYAIPVPPHFPHEQRAAVRMEEKTAPDAVVIAQAGRIQETKGYFQHIEALGMLRDLDGWIAWIIGGPQRPGEDRVFKALKEAARKAGIERRVRFLGQRADVSSLLAAADIYCQPNIGTEGLPIIFGEAMHRALPVVTSRIGGFDELIDESCGFLVPPGEVNLLARTLRTLVNDPELRIRLGQCGRTKAIAALGPGAQLPVICHLLRTLASRDDRSPE
jgi:glycosyltransferase involved in cell wall biosynthesis